MSSIVSRGRLTGAAVLVGVLALLLSVPRSAWASPITSDAIPTVSVSIDDGPGRPVWSYQPTPESRFPLPNGRGYGVPGSGRRNILAGRAEVEIAEMKFDPDPFVLNNVLITNTTATPQVFTVSMTLPTTFAAPNHILGTVLAGIIDGSGDGAGSVAALPGLSVYTAQIDGSPVATLLADPFSVQVPPGMVNSQSAAFGPLVSAVPVTSSIGIQLRFSLTAGDTASLLSRFDVVEVPEPGSLTLIGLASLALLRRRPRAVASAH